MEQPKTGQQPGGLTELARKVIVQLEIFFHVVAAFLLLVACVFIFYYAALNIFSPSPQAIINLVNDVLLSLIILELLWTVVRFLKKQKFLLGPFLAIGVIAAVRRILLIEAKTSFQEHVMVESLYEIGLSAVVIILLMCAYYISVKAQKLEQ